MNAVLPMSRATEVDPNSRAVLARLLTDAFEALDGDIGHVRATLARALALVDRSSKPAAAIGPSGLAPWQARTISDIVEAKLEFGVRTPELADCVGLSTSHFARAFKTHFGCSPKQ